MSSYYRNSLGGFLADRESEILGKLSEGWAQDGFRSLEHEQVASWQEFLRIFRDSLDSVANIESTATQWGILLEFSVPRRQKRIDGVILARDLILVVEFKAGARIAERDAIRQVEDYQLDLWDFHEPSRGRTIVPILLRNAALGTTRGSSAGPLSESDVYLASPSTLTNTLLDRYHALTSLESAPLNMIEWDQGNYWPVPTIIEAATALYAGMSVHDIAHSAAGSHNLKATADVLIDSVRQAQAKNERIICFVTGVPGSGKTLAGLNAVHNRDLRSMSGSAPVFLSGNGPLIRIVREALAWDHSLRTGATLRKSQRDVTVFVQNMHDFVRTHFEDESPPPERVIVFDEAQRAWNAQRNYRKRKKEVSEPQQILKIMDRHPNWSVIVALVGGGQEIHDGEAGLEEWGRTLSEKFRHWRVRVSPEALGGGQSVAAHRLFAEAIPQGLHVTELSDLHLNVSMRAYKAKQVNEWVNKRLDGYGKEATRAIPDEAAFPIKLTRHLGKARLWLREMTRGTRRCGLVASSGAARLRAHGIEMSSSFHRGYPFEHWFLSGPSDVRSSYQLEVAAREFEVQGLELDWVGLCWSDDLLWDASEGAWMLRRFAGKRFVELKDVARRGFLMNSYRVLLTRARLGLVIWVPIGDPLDSTRDVARLDETAQYLLDCGVKSLD